MLLSMNTTRRDYAAEQARREAWLTKRLVRKPQEIQASEVQVVIPGVGKFRIFKSPFYKGEWETYLHRQTPARELERKPESIRDLFRFEAKGTRENRTQTRREAIAWLAIHWDYAIERAIQEGE